MKTEEIEQHFNAAKEICLILNNRSKESQLRILRFFQSIISEKGNMQEEQEILLQVAKALGVKVD